MNTCNIILLKYLITLCHKSLLLSLMSTDFILLLTEYMYIST